MCPNIVIWPWDTEQLAHLSQHLAISILGHLFLIFISSFQVKHLKDTSNASLSLLYSISFSADYILSFLQKVLQYLVLNMVEILFLILSKAVFLEMLFSLGIVHITSYSFFLPVFFNLCSLTHFYWIVTCFIKADALDCKICSVSKGISPNQCFFSLFSLLKHSYSFVQMFPSHLYFSCRGHKFKEKWAWNLIFREIQQMLLSSDKISTFRWTDLIKLHFSCLSSLLSLSSPVGFSQKAPLEHDSSFLHTYLFSWFILFSSCLHEHNGILTDFPNSCFLLSN